MVDGVQLQPFLAFEISICVHEALAVDDNCLFMREQMHLDGFLVESLFLSISFIRWTAFFSCHTERSSEMSRF